MTISQLLDKYIAKDKDFFKRIIHQQQLNKQFENDIKSIQNQFPFISLYIFTIEKLAYKYNVITPETFIEFCNKLNVITMKDFYNINNILTQNKQVQNLMLFLLNQLEYKITTIDITKFEKIKYNEIRQKVLELITEQYKETNVKIHISDSEYYVIDENTLKKLLEYSVVDKLKYVPEQLDCDKFARLLKCSFMRYALGNISVSNIVINLYHKDFSGLYGAHAINLALLKNYENNNYYLKLIEPQTDNIFDFGEPTVNCKYYKIREIVF